MLTARTLVLVSTHNGSEKQEDDQYKTVKDISFYHLSIKLSEQTFATTKDNWHHRTSLKSHKINNSNKNNKTSNKRKKNGKQT